jgi:trigger factor
MQVSLETTSGLERKMRVSVPADEIDTQVDVKIKQTAQQVKLKGFRPGKVPLSEVKRRFGAGIRQEVSSEVIQSSFNSAVQQESVVPAGTPKIEDVTLETGQDLEYTAIFEVFPEVEPGDFSKVTIEQPVSEVNDDDLDLMTDKLQEQRIEYVDVDRAAAEDDKVNIDFEGFIDDEPFDGGKAEGSDLIIGSSSMIPGFEEGLVGSKAGDTPELNVSFPEDYQAENLAGKAAVFKTIVNKVSEPKRPALDDEFFKQFGVEEGGLSAFRTEIRGNMEKELDRAVKQRTKTQVMDSLIETTAVEVPKALIDNEVNRMRQEAVQQYGGSDKIDPSVLPAEMFESQAQKRVTLGLIVNAIVEKSSLTVDEDRVQKTIEEMASSYDDAAQVINFYNSNEQQMMQIKNMVLEEQVVELLVDKATVKEVKMSYEEVMESLQAEGAGEKDDSDES